MSKSVCFAWSSETREELLAGGQAKQWECRGGCLGHPSVQVTAAKSLRGATGG